MSVDQGDGLTHYMTGPPIKCWCASSDGAQPDPVVVIVTLHPDDVTCQKCRSAALLTSPERLGQQALF